MIGLHAPTEVANSEGCEPTLEQQNKGVRLLNATFLPESNKEKAVVFLPDTHKDFYEKKIELYGTEVTFKGNPKQADFAGRIVMWANEQFDKNHPDTFGEKVK